VLSPLLAGSRFPELADLPKASSLCGACNEVCPVNIPIPDLLLRLRDRGKREHSAPAAAATPPLGLFSLAATQAIAWKAGLALGGLIAVVPKPLLPRAAKSWINARGLPPWRGGQFRKWLKLRAKK
jgi:L-lactate dehydrogenase complex protein LldF